MQVDIQADGFRNRKDLMDIVTAAADYLKSRNRYPELGARACWRLWADSQGQPKITLELSEGGYSASATYTPAQLAPPDIRGLRMLDAWDGVLKYRIDEQTRRTNEVIAQLED